MSAESSAPVAGLLLVVGLFCAIPVVGAVIGDSQAASIAEEEQAFIDDHPGYGLQPALTRDSATADGLTSALARSMCLTAIEKTGAELDPAVSEDNYRVFPTKSNDSFYVLARDKDGGQHTCKADGGAADPTASVL